MDYRHWIDTEFAKKSDWVLITGATSGIGYEYLKLLAAERCNCIIISNEGEMLESVSQDLSAKFGISIQPIFCDLSEIDQIMSLAEKLRHYKIRFLINNAAFGHKGDFLSAARETIVDIITVNSTAYSLITHMVLPGMREMNSGAIISVGSINILSPVPKSAVYTASKFYDWAFCLAVAYENRDYNILFHAVLPGTTITAFHTKQGSNPRAITMTPEAVAKRSLDNLGRRIYVPNRIDRVAFHIFYRLPWYFRMRLATYVLKLRLGV